MRTTCRETYRALNGDIVQNQGGSPQASLPRSEGSRDDQAGEVGSIDWRPRVSKVSQEAIRLVHSDHMVLVMAVLGGWSA